MFTLMKSEKTKPETGEKGPRTYEQKVVCHYPALGDAMAACDTANRKLQCRYYIIDDFGKEFYADRWID